MEFPLPLRPPAAALLLSSALAALPLAGQPADPTLLDPSDLKRMSVEQLLQQEIVSVSRHAEALGQTASNVFYISGDVARLTGAESLPEALRLAPTLFVAQSSSYHWGVNARGFMRTNAHSNKLLVLIDGRTAYLPLFSNVFWDSTDVFLPDLDSIEVISGPNGSSWGSNAVNGVINVRSKSARDTLGQSVKVAAGTGGLQVQARQGVRAGANGALRVYAQHTNRRATLGPGAAEDDRDAWHASQAGFRADWGGPEQGEFTLSGDWLSGRYDAGPQPDVRNDAGHVLLRWSRELSADSSLWWRAYYDYVKRDSSGLLTETTRTADLEFQHSLVVAPDRHVLWGANYRRICDEAEDTAGFILLPPRLWLSLAAVFAQHEASWSDERLRLTTGLRFEHNDFTGWETQPTVRLAWQERRFTAWLAAGRATRTPSRIEKGFFLPAAPPYVVAGGPDFVSEILHSYEVGWRGQVATGLALTATVYHHDYDNLRSVEPGPPIVQANGVGGRSHGLEWFVDYDVTSAWRLRAGGFVMQQETWIRPGGADTEGARGESSFPDYQLFLRSTFRLSDRADLWLSLRRIGAVPAAEGGGGAVPAYTELDAQLGWRLRPNVRMALFGRNLLDASHPEIGGRNLRREIKRVIGVSLTWER